MLLRYKGEGVITMAEFGASSYRRVPLGENDLLEKFVTAYSDALVRFAYTYVRSAAAAEDVAAEAIALVLYRRKKFPDEARLRAYLYKVTRTRALDHLRRHRDEVPLEDVENVLGGGDPAQGAMRRQRDEMLYRCLDRLPGQYRQVLVLAYLENFSVKQICAVTGMHTKQVYNLLARARVALKELLEQEGITHEDF